VVRKRTASTSHFATQLMQFPSFIASYVLRAVWTKDNDAQLVKTVVQQIGMQTSAWEHKIPEILFSSEENPGEAVSAVKALGIAAAEGQRIYQITKDNVDVVLPNLSIGSEVKREIKDSVAVGKIAVVSQNNIIVDGWTGVGYIIADADTGAGAYRISGGNNGANHYPSDSPIATIGFYSLMFGGLVSAISLFFFSAMLIGLIGGMFFSIGLLMYFMFEPDAHFSAPVFYSVMFFFGGLIPFMARYGLLAVYGSRLAKTYTDAPFWFNLAGGVTLLFDVLRNELGL